MTVDQDQGRPAGHDPDRDPDPERVNRRKRGDEAVAALRVMNRPAGPEADSEGMGAARSWRPFP